MNRAKSPNQKTVIINEEINCAISAIDGLGVGCLPQFGQAIACLEI
jgi:hypothetical protein